MPGSVRFAWLLPLIVAGATSAAAQDQGQALIGMRLFNQSCRVCHTQPQLASPRYGPALSHDTLAGNVDLIGQFIANGSPRMPGFRYQFTSEQIAAIAAYVATLPVPAQAATGTGKAAAGRDAD